jgi:hypothetical protein
VSKVPAVEKNRHHLSIANLAQFQAKLGIDKFFLYVFGQKTKSQLELLHSPVYTGNKGVHVNFMIRSR